MWKKCRTVLVRRLGWVMRLVRVGFADGRWGGSKTYDKFWWKNIQKLKHEIWLQQRYIFYLCIHVFFKPGAFSPRSVCDWSKASLIPEGPTMSVFNNVKFNKENLKLLFWPKTEETLCKRYNSATNTSIFTACRNFPLLLYGIKFLCESQRVSTEAPGVDDLAQVRGEDPQNDAAEHA